MTSKNIYTAFHERRLSSKPSQAIRHQNYQVRGVSCLTVPELSKWITISISEFLLTPMGFVLATYSRITEGELVLDGVHATTSRGLLKKQHTS
jgi:hypothetical protein